MAMGEALIGAGASLLGGVFGKSKTYSPREMALGHVEGVMQAAETFGLNPLTILGSIGGPSAVSGSNYMGQAIADAGLMLADGLAKQKELGRLSQLERQNQYLAQKVQSLTLRPKVAGIYGGLETVPTLRQALGVGDASAAVQGVSTAGVSGVGDRVDLRPLMEVDSGSFMADPRRPVDNDPIKTHSGYIVVDNPQLPVPVRVPTLDGDEALQWYDYPSLLLPAAAAFGDFLRSPAFGPPDGYARDGEPLGVPKPYSPNKKSPSYMPFGWSTAKKPKKKRRDPLAGLGF